MPNLFGVNVKKRFGQALGGKLPSLTLTKVTNTTRSSPSGGFNTTTTDYKGRGSFFDFKDHEMDETMVKDGVRGVFIVADSISATPSTEDLITIESNTYRIMEVNRDPAEAAYYCRVKPQ